MPSSPMKRGPYAKTQAQRSAIAAAALDLVIRRGHRDVTTAEIAEAAGMRKTAALYHYPTRDHMLVAALLEHEHRTHLGEPSLGLLDIAEQARRGVRRQNIVRLYQEMVANSHDPDHPAHDYLANHVRAGVENYGAQIRMAQDAGLVSPEIDPEFAARIIVASWDGLQLQWLNDPVFDIGKAIERTMRAVLGTDTLALQS